MPTITAIGAHAQSRLAPMGSAASATTAKKPTAKSQSATPPDDRTGMTSERRGVAVEDYLLRRVSHCVRYS